MSEIITGRNAVIEALKSGRTVEKIIIARGSQGSVKKIETAANEKNIKVYYDERGNLDRKAGTDSHQGVMAVVSDYVYSTVDDILDRAESRQEAPLVVVLDGIEDPRNLGAIMRTAECAGAHGIIIPDRRSAAVTDTVEKTSAGAAEHVLCARVTNIVREIEILKKRGLWIAACNMDGESLYKTDMTGPLAIVIGGEGGGIGRLVLEKCDFTVSIPMNGVINSLNASNAAAIVMYEVIRQRENG